MKIIFIHSLNNYTGSPNILSTIVKGFLYKGYETELSTTDYKKIMGVMKEFVEFGGEVSFE